MKKYASTGFSLIELMVTVAIVAILGTIAVTSYDSQIRRANRTDGTSALLDLMAKEERFFTLNNRYTSTLTGLGYSDDDGDSAVETDNDAYEITAAACSGSTLATCVILTATPQGGQANDTDCANFTYTSQDIKGVSGSAGADNCW